MIEWGMPKQGRELKALEVFNSHMQWCTELQQSGKIEQFMPFGLTTGNVNQRSGFVLIAGTTEQIDELRRAEDFRNRYNTVVNVADNVNLVVLETGDAMEARLVRYAKSIKELGE